MNFMTSNELNFLLRAEFDTWIETLRGVYRNGTYKRNLETENGVVVLTIPRARNKNFSTSLFNKWQRKEKNFLNKLASISTDFNDIKKLRRIIKSIYNYSFSQHFFYSLASKFRKSYKDFKRRELKNKYKAIFADTTFCRFSNCCYGISFLLGANKGEFQVLDYRITKNENLNAYLSMIENLKDRKVSTDLFVIDGFAGLNSAVKESKISKNIQSCFNHFIRNLNKKIKQKPNSKSELLKLKNFIFEIAKSNHSHKRCLKEIAKFFNENRSLLKKLRIGEEDLKNLVSFKILPKDIQRSFYTNNIIENFNKQLKGNLKTYYKSSKSLDQDIATFILDSAIY